MAGLKTTITLQDRMSSVLRNITKTTTTTINNLKAAGIEGDKAFSPDKPSRMRDAILKTKNAISEARDKQYIFNAEMEKGSGIAGGLAGKVKSLVAAYAGMRTIKGLVEMSDQLAQNYARLNLMNDGLQTTKELFSAIQQSAKESRGDFQDTFSFVAKIGNTARGAFKSSKEIVKFAELIQKSFKISGTKATEASNAMLQLSQALGAGVLRGEDLRSIFGQAPGLIQLIAKELDVDVGKIRKMGEEGKLTADVIRNAVFNAADDINAKFAEIPMTWADVWTNLKTDAITALEPVLGVINKLANNQSVVKMMQGIADVLKYVAVAAGWVLEKNSAVYEFFVNNWDWIAPIILGVGLAIASYTIVSKDAIVATKAWELAQKALGIAIAFCNSKLLIAMVIIGALIAGFVALCIHLGKTNSAATSTFGKFVAGLYIVGAWFKNLGIIVKGVFGGIWEVIKAVAYNFTVDWHNSIADVTSRFWQFLSDVMYIVGAAAKALNKLPFVSIDAEGLFSKADAWAKKSGDIASSMMQYKDYGAAFAEGYDKAGGNTAFADGWKEEAAKAGEEAFANLKNKFSFNMTAANAEGYGETLNSIADDTGSIAKSLGTTNEELAWLRDIAEREAINRFTTAEIKIDMTGMTNEIHRDVDVDGIYNKFVGDFGVALQTVAAGVY